MSTLSKNDPLVVVRDLLVRFGSGDQSPAVIHGVSYELGHNEWLAVVGESGSGKSVTAKVLMGLLPKQSAHITAQELRVAGREVLQYKSEDWSRFRGSEIAMIFQEPMSSLNPTITCGKQVAEVLQQHTKLTSAQIKQQVLALFEKVRLPHPEVTFKKYPHQISGGQMQRVMIAMALACKPKILIADEPTTALDVTVQQEIIRLLKDLQKEYGLSIIFISHDLSLVKNVSDRILVMYKGNIVEEGTPHDLFESPKESYTKALIAARPNPNQRLKRLPTIADFLEQTLDEELITPQQRRAQHQRIYGNPPILQVQDLVKEYPVAGGKQSFKALNGVAIDLYKGESLGVVGESGCGKSTLGNCVLGLKKPTSGSILYKGIDLALLSHREMRAYRKDLQIIFQDPFASLNPRLTVGKAITEPMKWHHIGDNDADRKERVMELLRKVGLDDSHYDRYPHEFSGGQRQRIGIARTVALEPRVIICDESVSALDISVQAQVLNLLNSFKEDYGFSYVFISHDLAVVQYFCDRVAVMNSGRIIEYNDADEVYRNPQSDYTKQLIAAIPGAS